MGAIRILTDKGTEYCNKPEAHHYQLSLLGLNDIEYTAASGFCELLCIIFSSATSAKAE